jgi:hypothetical protein
MRDLSGLGASPSSDWKDAIAALATTVRLIPGLHRASMEGESCRWALTLLLVALVAAPAAAHKSNAEHRTYGPLATARAPVSDAWVRVCVCADALRPRLVMGLAAPMLRVRV